MRFEITVKNSHIQIAHIMGRDVDAKHISVADIEKVIEVEQYLERLTGHRFHIQTNV